MERITPVHPVEPAKNPPQRRPGEHTFLQWLNFFNGKGAKPAEQAGIDQTSAKPDEVAANSNIGQNIDVKA